MANNLTLTGATFDTSGQKFGTGALNGGYGVSPNNLIPTTYPFTLEAWVKGTSGQAPGAVRVIMGANKLGFVGCDSANHFTAQYSASSAAGATASLTTTIPVFDGAWHHVALVLDASGGRLYVDGAQAASVTNVYTWDSTNYTARNIGVGNHAGLTNFQWPGEIDEAVVWSTGRYTAGFTPPSSAYTGLEAGVLALWHLDGNGTDTTGGTPATAYTLSGPSSGTVGATSSAFTVQAKGTLASSVTVTPADNGGGGTFTPSVLTLAAGASTSATFTYTPGSAGTKTISTTNSGALTNPSSLTYTASASTTTITPDSAGLVYSPGNWLVGSASAKTINPGAYFRTIFTGPSCTLNFDVSTNGTPLPQLYYRVDGVSWTQVTLAANILLIMPSGTSAWPHHHLEVVVKSTSEWLSVGATQGGSRWSPQNAAVVLSSLTLASGQSVSTPSTLGQTVWFFGDSITEGYHTVNGNGSGTQDTDGSDAMLGWAFLQRHLLGAEVAVIGFGGAAINAGGALGVPSLPNSYGYLWSGQARSFSPGPDLIVINYGENDGTSIGDSTFIANYSAVLTGLLSATPATTKIACLVPFSQRKAADIASAIVAVGSARVSKIDTTGMFSTTDSADGQHPYGVANLGVIAPQLANKLRPLLQGVRSRWSRSLPLLSGTAPSQIGIVTPGAQTVTTIPVTYTAPSAGTAPITYQGFASPHGSGVWTANAGTFADTGGTFIGLAGGTNYDLRIVATNAYGSSTRDYLPGTTAVSANWTNGLAASRYDIVLSGSSGAPGSARTATLYPNGNWPGSGSITLTATNGTFSPSATVTLSGGSAPLSVTWTPSAAGELAISGTNTAGLSNPWPAPYTCLAAAAGTAQTLSVTTAVWTDPTGGYVRDRRNYQKDAPSGNPNGFSTAANVGWGAVWFQINPGGSSSGVFARLYDADSTGATTTAGTGTLVQAAVQVYGAVNAGSQTIRTLMPASDTRYYADLATDAAFTNPVRVPQSFFVRDLMAVMVRSQEGSLATNWEAGTIMPGSPYNAYKKTVGIAGFQTPQDTSATDAWYANSWAPSDGVTTTFVNNVDGNYFAMQSAATMELGRVWAAKKGHGLGIVGVAVVDGSNATFASFVGTDGTPCAGFRAGVVSQCGGKFRYLRTNLNDGGGPLSYGTAGCRTALHGLVSYFAAHYPGCAVMSLGLRSGQGTSGDANSTGEVDQVIRDEFEAVDARVATGNSSPEWGWFYRSHPDFDSQVLIARGVVQSLLYNETPTFGGSGFSFADRWPRLRAVATHASGSRLIQVPIDLPTGSTALNAKTIHATVPGFTYNPADTNDLISITFVIPPGGGSVLLSSVVINNSTSPPTLDITIDPSATLPPNCTVYFGVYTNYNPYTPVSTPEHASTDHDPAWVYDDRDMSATYGIPANQPRGMLQPRIKIAITEV